MEETSIEKGEDGFLEPPLESRTKGEHLCMINTQNGVHIMYYVHELCRSHIIRIMKFSCIIQMVVLIRYFS
jgi:hypothetical protein